MLLEIPNLKFVPIFTEDGFNSLLFPKLTGSITHCLKFDGFPGTHETYANGGTGYKTLIAFKNLGKVVIIWADLNTTSIWGKDIISAIWWVKTITTFCVKSTCTAVLKFKKKIELKLKIFGD